MPTIAGEPVTLAEVRAPWECSAVVHESGMLPYRIVIRDLGDQLVVHTQVFEPGPPLSKEAFRLSGQVGQRKWPPCVFRIVAIWRWFFSAFARRPVLTAWRPCGW